jgi:hypothetical protein
MFPFPNATVDGELDFVSMDADGFTVVPDNGFTATQTVHALCLGGADLTNVKVGTFALAAATGNQAVTGVGFQPSCVIFFWAKRTNTSANAVTANAGIGVGWATSSSARAAIGAASQDNVADTNSRGMIVTDNCINILGGGVTDVISDNHDFVSMDSDGFTVNKLTGADQSIVGYIAMKGPRFKVGTTAMRTDTNDQVVTGVGFQGKALLTMFRPPVTASETTAPSVHWEIGMGCAVDSTHQAAIWSADEDALATSDNYSKNSSTRCVMDFDKETAATDEGDMAFKTWDADGFTLDQNTASAVATLVPYLVIAHTVDPTWAFGSNPSMSPMSPMGRGL